MPYEYRAFRSGREGHSGLLAICGRMHISLANNPCQPSANQPPGKQPLLPRFAMLTRSKGIPCRTTLERSERTS
eukprot:2815621-Rhodomonas_salina.1